MSSEPVHPLRISKNPAPMASPTKRTSAIPRPLSEISPAETRRNSPSWNQKTGKKMGLNGDSSPFQSSPLDMTTSPRMFWQNRGGFGSENTYDGGRSGSPSPTRRSSIERLQKASRVKNSSILALEQKNEYDPTRLPRVERPLAKVQQNAYGGLGIVSPRNSHEVKGHQRSESKTNLPRYSPTKMTLSSSSLDSTSDLASRQPEPDVEPQTIATVDTSVENKVEQEQASPIKSSLANRFKNSYNENGDFTVTGGGEYDPESCPSPQRNAKSVTFDAAPPQVNEYEMATPDLSSVGSNSREGSFESEEDDEDYDDYRYFSTDGASQEDSFDASLEDTDKTPVVGPDDWRQDSPDSRRGHAFDGSPMPDVHPSSAMGHQDACSMSGSGGDHRPLPPLPGMLHARSHSESSPGLSATAERMLGGSGSLRGLPAPPPASVTKSEIQNIGSSKMSLEERLRLMMLSDDGKSAAEQQRERRMRRAGAKDRAGSQTPEPEAPLYHDEEEDTIGDLSGLEEYQLPPRISRESILRRVNGGLGQEHESDYNFSSPAPSSSPERRLPLDPDVPIPSTEVDEDSDMLDASMHEGETYDFGLPDIDNKVINSDRDLSADRDGSESAYSESLDGILPPREGDSLSTPRAATPVMESASSHVVQEHDIHLPEVPTLALEGRLSMGDSHLPILLQPSENAASEPERPVAEAQESVERPRTPEPKSVPKPLSKPEYDGSGWGDDEEYEEEPSTPDSVIHHPIEHDQDDGDIFEEEEDIEVEVPDVPEQLATIKASGSKLKTRPSATPSDIMSMREARRHVSGEQAEVPPIPERHRNRLSRDMGAEAAQQAPADASGDDFLDRHPSFKNRSLTLDLDLGLSLDQDFERVIEQQKVESYDFSLSTTPFSTSHQTPSVPSPARQVSANDKCSDTAGRTKTQNDLPDTNIAIPKQRGYLMRQNTKLVAASDKHSDDFRGGARSAGNSPVKKDRPQSWTVEPWNGEKRAKSQRKRSSMLTGPVPPLPGQESNAAILNPLVEEETTTADASNEEGAERGRLFVKVMGVKDLDLPVPRNERTWFSLTLDNGVHCVTTAWLEMARNAPIGQEFELLVPNDLEFQLTLNVKLEKPVIRKAAPAPAKAVRPKTSTFSRVFASPKKRKEMELRFKEEEERQAREHREAQAKLRNAHPTAYDLLSPLVAEDGSFARAYVCLKEYESRCYGRPGVVEVACFNEWATEEAGFASSVKSKRGDAGIVRRAPYKIGKLELQLLFVPRPKNVTNDDMPKSMNSCIREMKAAEERQSRNWEGHLSQQGGDCPYWRRRYFKLVGTKLTAYHEATRQPRATINLGNARRLIDDRRALTEKETTAKNGKRRRSGFAEEEEGYMFVEEGFRIRFNNGEVIDFYADTAADKEGWMKVLSDVIARDSSGSDDDGMRAKSKWCELVLKREEALRRRTEGRRVHSRTKSSMLT